MAQKPDSAAIIAAGGSGTRMGGELPKQFLELAGIPLFVHCVQAFAAVPEVGRIVVVARSDYLTAARQMLARHDLADVLVVAGGASRQDSVACGLAALAALPERYELVAVHDGARPLVSPNLIQRTLAAARRQGAAIAALPVRDTLKKAGAAEGNANLPLIDSTISRTGLWQAQTPQAARFILLQKALAAADTDGFTGTDEASLLERIGCPVALVEGESANFKITTPQDLPLAQATLASTSLPVTGHGDRLPLPRIGHGYDVHRLVTDRPLILGGVTIEHHLGLLGHSDADVLTHALCDAILGALGAGDIGRHFPDNDQQYRGISSLKLLAQVMTKVWAANCRLHHADLTIIAEKPKLAPQLAAMQANLAAACQVNPSQINLKATTTEGLGFAGREEGIAAHAVALLL
ncbi:2-C-methyl-D-erythritol 4-phosphate cytidylyltransferase [Desulfurivibrio alkaliphilus]|uniref:Bifunctional enzyme IspD/IspF n=1 Tax=Desulfurivibrio alkaliphilus (strain DSM 19089 / UNIQEM U267 / AHT2) TaxID=589865 RepID=D6Z573_DESAT|nr:2-C-methyl-D-erythritol 4-phosphate cytidylyltransferase [Desulfurivibrio alkaliphilus]ADH84730.1 2-C-methyl-D-erythritol 4-phosphate cytidylyltransferase [Desulfurivibrio alkaliphilus AHT 2]